MEASDVNVKIVTTQTADDESETFCTETDGTLYRRDDSGFSLAYTEPDEELFGSETSVTLCSLLHDVCKADQFYVDARGVPQCNRSALGKGHGRRSMFLVLRAGLPLNYDEAMAIWWHMGEYEKSREYHQKEYTESLGIDLCNLIREADRTAADKAMPADDATE